MEESYVSLQEPKELRPCSPSTPFAENIFNLKFSDLHASKYSYFLKAFTDERDFEEFKKDLRDFQKLKTNHQSVIGGSGSSNNNNVCVVCPSQRKQQEDDSDSDLNIDLEIICRQDTARKNRRRSHLRASASVSDRDCKQSSCQEARFRSPYICECESNHNNNNIRIQTDSIDSLSSPDQTNNKHSSPHHHRQEKAAATATSSLRPDSFGLRGDFDRRNLIFGYDRSGLRSSINDILMDFINGDEHFREFERVFETVNNRRNSKDRRLSIPKDIAIKAPTDENLVGDIRGHMNSNVRKSRTMLDDSFADFFDNDEDFQAFEQEFANLRAGRRSRYFGSLSSFGSSKDIFGDVKSYCERSLTDQLKSCSELSVSSCASAGVEATPDCTGDNSGNREVDWKSLQDWEHMFKKMHRNSRLFSDTKYHCKKRRRQRHSVCDMTTSVSNQERYQKTQSLADIPGRLADSDSTSSSTSNSTPERKCTVMEHQSNSASMDRVPSVSSLDLTLEGHGTVVYDSNDSDANSCDVWSDSYLDDVGDGDVRYSSSSTLCSSHGGSGTYCSFSSDLHIHEDSDVDVSSTFSPSLSSPRQRSQSLQGLELTQQNQQRLDLCLTKFGSYKSKGRPSRCNSIYCDHCDPSHHPLLSQSQPSFHKIQSSCQLYQHDTFGTERLPAHPSPSFDSALQDTSPSDSEYMYMMPSSTSSSSRHGCSTTTTENETVALDTGNPASTENDRWETQTGSTLSLASGACSFHLAVDSDDAEAADDESDQFHSAKSDFSEHFHTAKSDLPAHRRHASHHKSMMNHRLLAARHRSQSADMAGISMMDDSDRSRNRVDAWLSSSPVSHTDIQTASSDARHGKTIRPFIYLKNIIIQFHNVYHNSFSDVFECQAFLISTTFLPFNPSPFTYPILYIHYFGENTLTHIYSWKFYRS